jgi:hypothetical protein
MTPSHRKMLGLAVAPLAPVLMMLFPSQILRDGRLSLNDRTSALIVVFVLVAGYTMSFIVGVPLYFILRLRHWTSWLAYMSAAYVMGVIATPVAGLIWVFWRTRSWLLVVQTGSNLPTILPDVLLTSLLATPIGLLFWLIVRPDRRG